MLEQAQQIPWEQDWLLMTGRKAKLAKIVTSQLKNQTNSSRAQSFEL